MVSKVDSSDVDNHYPSDHLNQDPPTKNEDLNHLDHFDIDEKQVWFDTT